MHNIVVLLNPHSGLNLRNKWRIWKIRSLLTEGKVYPTKSWKELEDIASEIPNMKPDIIAIDGGDGTISTVAGAVYRHWPKDVPLPYFAFLSGGTFNALPKHVGIQQGIPYLQAIVETPKEQLFCQDVDFLEVEDNHGRKSLGFSFGIGLPVLLLQEFYKKKRKKWKYLRVAWMVLKILMSAAVDGKYFQKFNRHTPLRIGNKEGNWLAVLCQTIPSFGIPKCSMFYRAGITHGKFHVLATDAALDELGWYFTAIYGGRCVPVMQMDMQTDTLSIQSEMEFLYQVNGELEFWKEKYLAQEVHLRHGLTLKVIKPIPKHS